MTHPYETIFETLQLDDVHLQGNLHDTIRPTVATSVSADDLIEGLPRFEMGTQAQECVDFHIVDTLGEGGMGIVSLAEQRALRRLVALKEPKGDNAQAHTRVLDEAFILGRIEHPNVVPAYGLGRRSSGQPILVMKRVEGIEWNDVIVGKKSPPDGSHPDILWHLRVLLQVCNALRFAHARQVVHRDIKPENVMIGAFGEIYLLDWGIALSLDPNAGDGIPTATTASGIAGTPVFMAPEMTTGDASLIDERTDVYLLGANLHLLLTGQPPHTGKTLMAVCIAANESIPKHYGEGVASELGEIAKRAMAREKEDRWQSVADFAAAISDYIEHRASYQLCDIANDLLTKHTSGLLSPERSNAILEAEFGFRQALVIWSENEVARRGLQVAIETKIDILIERKELKGAQAALTQLPAPNASLTDRVEVLSQYLSEHAQRVDYLEQFEQELDLRTGAKSRQRTVLVLGVAFVLICFTSAWSSRPGQPNFTLDDWMDSYWRLLIIAAVATLFFWRKLVANVANRRLVTYFLSALIAIFVLRFAAVRFQAPQLFLLIAEQCTMGMAAAAIGVSTSRRLTFVSLSYVVAIFATIVASQIWVGYIAFGCAHLVFFGCTAWLWRQYATDSAQQIH